MMTAHTFFLILVIAIPISGFLAGVAKRWLRLKGRQLEMMVNETAKKAAQYATRTEKLEQRVAVLERIATENGRGLSLDREIEALRQRG